MADKLKTYRVTFTYPSFTMDYEDVDLPQRSCVIQAMDEEMAATGALVYRKLPMEIDRRSDDVYWVPENAAQSPEVIEPGVLSWGDEDNACNVTFTAEEIAEQPSDPSR